MDDDETWREKLEARKRRADAVDALEESNRFKIASRDAPETAAVPTTSLKVLKTSYQKADTSAEDRFSAEARPNTHRPARIGVRRVLPWCVSWTPYARLCFARVPSPKDF
jgi:hypothetical protein